MARKPEYLKSRVGYNTETVYGDVLDESSLVSAMAGCEIAYYLIHSMGNARDFESEDRAGASHFAEACRRVGVQRIIYLGGAGEPGDDLSKHLRSRHEVGQILRSTGVEVIEFRASIIIGSGSLSFELIRSLVERLPIMICPRWVSTPCQPISIEDVLAYLAAAIELPRGTSRIFEIGGPDRVSYGDLMKEYARQRGLKRIMLRIPLLTPRLSSLWLGLVTPVYARIGRKLIEGLRNPTAVNDQLALSTFQIQPRSLAEAIERAIKNEGSAGMQSRWLDSLSSAGRHSKWGGVRFGERIVDCRTLEVDASPEKAFSPIQRIGGKNGWYWGNSLWRLRGWIDLAVGGVGYRRSRRDPVDLRTGDTIDFWRVESFEPGRLLRLVAEMRLPGRAWLEFEVNPHNSHSRIRQTAIFEPLGLSGLLYWYALYPVHAVVFSRMILAIARASGGSVFS